MKRLTVPATLTLAIIAFSGSTALALAEDAHHPAERVPSAGTQGPAQATPSPGVSPQPQAPDSPAPPPESNGQAAGGASQSGMVNCPTACPMMQQQPAGSGMMMPGMGQGMHGGSGAQGKGQMPMQSPTPPGRSGHDH